MRFQLSRQHQLLLIPARKRRDECVGRLGAHIVLDQDLGGARSNAWPREASSCLTRLMERHVLSDIEFEYQPVAKSIFGHEPHCGWRVDVSRQWRQTAREAEQQLVLARTVDSSDAKQLARTHRQVDVPRAHHAALIAHGEML